MEREAALIAKNVEPFAMRILRGSGVVLPLIEEGASLLPFERVEVKLHAVHGEDRRSLLSCHQAGGSRRQLFQLSDSRIDALNN